MHLYRRLKTEGKQLPVEFVSFPWKPNSDNSTWYKEHVQISGLGEGGGVSENLFTKNCTLNCIDIEIFVNMSPGPLLENSNLLHSHGEFTKICLQPPPGKQSFLSDPPLFWKKKSSKKDEEKNT